MLAKSLRQTAFKAKDLIDKERSSLIDQFIIDAMLICKEKSAKGFFQSKFRYPFYFDPTECFYFGILHHIFLKNGSFAQRIYYAFRNEGFKISFIDCYHIEVSW